MDGGDGENFKRGRRERIDIRVGRTSRLSRFRTGATAIAAA